MADIAQRQPSNPNYLQNVHFRFILKRAPNVVYFAQEASLPSVSLAVAEQAGPFVPILRHGNKMKFDYFNITFKVDEDFKNYSELYNWMVGLGFPDGFEDFKKLTQNNKAGDGTGIWSDGTLSILDSAKNPNIEFIFQNMFPISLSALDFDLTNSDLTFVNCTATFAYHRFTVNKLGLTT